MNSLTQFKSILGVSILATALACFLPPTFAQDQISDPEILQLREEINAAPNDVERGRIRLRLVERLVFGGLKQEALAELQSMSSENRFDPQGFYNVANAQARLGDSESAVNTYRKAIEQRKGHYSRALNNLGVVLLRLGRWDEAYDALTSAMRLESFRYAEASYNLGRVYAARGENDLAVREWRRALSIDSGHTAATRAIREAGSAGSITVAARTPKSTGVRSVASSKSERSRSKNNNEESPSNAASSTSGAHAANATPAFTVDSETYDYLQRGRAAREKNRNEDAVKNYRRVIARMGGYFPPANLELGYSLIALRRGEEALASLLPVAAKDGVRFPISYYHVARLYEVRGELKFAEEYYTRAADAYGESNAQFLLDLSRVREKLGNASGALASLEKYLKILEAQGQQPAWSTERLAALRLKANEPQKKEP